MSTITDSRVVPAGEPKPIIPPLASFYSHTRDLSWLVVRLTAGGMLLVHGIMKMMPMAEKGFATTIDAFAAGSMARRGIEPAIFAAYAVFFLETIGAVLIILGLFTRLIAAAAEPSSSRSLRSSRTGRKASHGRGADGSIRCFGASSSLPSPCAAAGPIHSTASSVGSCSRSKPRHRISDRRRVALRALTADPILQRYSATPILSACAASFERRHKPPTSRTRTAPTSAANNVM
jgi:hypothetical protein